VAVIDTGLQRNHTDLSANAWTNTDEVAANGIDDDHDGYVDDRIGWDWVNNDANPDDDNFHGTHVSGTIGARGEQRRRRRGRRLAGQAHGAEGIRRERERPDERDHRGHRLRRGQPR
jgi:subtilisin family serine protease